LLLHGFPDCWFSWRNQIPFLSQTYRVIALDLKGFNDSDKPMMRHKYHPKTVCNEIKLFLDALEISNVNIIGHDLGGLVAWYFTIIYPGYVSRLVQIATPHPNLYWNLSKNALTTKYWCNMIQLPFLPEIELTKYEEFIEKFHQNNNDSEVLNFSTQDILNTYKYIFNNRRDWRGPLNYFRNFLFYRVDPKFYFRCPITFIIGEIYVIKN
jgi:epoxide hydrolase 4